VSIKNVDYDKFRDYLNYHVELYSSFVNNEIHSKDTNTYLLTIKDNDNNHETLKKFMPNLFKKLRKNDFSYFSSWEIGKQFLIHNHVDVVCDKDIDMDKIINKYIKSKSVNQNFPAISIHVKQIKHKTNYNYITKKFDVNHNQSLENLDNNKFYSYVKLLNRYFRLYSLFSFHFK